MIFDVLKTLSLSPTKSEDENESWIEDL